MQLFYLVNQYSKKESEWKRVALKIYLCWSVCVDMVALAGILWYVFR